MKKTFCMKLITCILIFMILMNGILPNNIVFAGLDDKTGYTPIEDEWYRASHQTSTNITGDATIYENEDYYKKIYYIDENGQKQTPTISTEDGMAKVYLEAGVTYYRDNSYIDGFNAHTVDKAKDDASLIEALITRLLLFVGGCLYGIFQLVVGEDFSIEKVIFNEYGNTNLGFFEGSKVNPYIENAGVKPILNDLYNFFSGITLAVYLIILVYMAIKIMLGSTAEKGSKYKQLIIYWVEGILILFIFPYIMKYSIQINEAFVSFTYANKNQYLIELSEQMPIVVVDSDNELKNIGDMVNGIVEETKYKTDFMSVMYNTAMEEGWLVLAICWYVMFFQMIGFLIVYFKRVIVIMFLIAVFPFVMISYAIDKIGDAKSQAFGNWVKEFLVNVFVQSFHVIAYVLVMSVICELTKDPSKNWLLILIAITFISKGDDILRGIFSMNSKSGTVKGITATIGQAVVIKSISQNIRGVKDRLIGQKSLGRRLYNSAGNLSQKAWDKVDNRVRATAAEIELSKMPKMTELSKIQTNEEIEKLINKDIKKLLSKDATADEIRNSADRLTSYLNQNNNDVQSILNKIAASLTPAEREKLDKLLQANASANALMVGGRDININQNVNFILECIKDKNTAKAGMAILEKIGKSEDDLKAVKLIENVKFNKDKVPNSKDSNRRTSARRVQDSRKNRARGRTAARNRGYEASSSLEYALKANSSVATTKNKADIVSSNKTEIANSSTRVNARKKISRIVGNPQNLVKNKANAKPEYKNLNNNQTSRVEKQVNALDRAVRYYAVSKGIKATTKPLSTTSYDNKVPERKVVNTSADKSIHTVREMRDLKESIKNNAKRQVNEDKTKLGNSTAFRINRNENNEIENDSNVKANVNTNSKLNIGADIANKSGTIENLVGIISRDTYVSKADEILNDVIKNPNTKIDSLYQRNTNTEFTKDEHKFREYVDQGIIKKLHTREAKKDFEDAARLVRMLKSTDKGDYTANEILYNIKSLKDIVKKYENANVDERTAIEDIVNSLDCKLEDYESYVRIKILNDPDSVGNNRNVIEESKEYVKNTEMPEAIRDRLGYRLEDLEVGQNLKYVRVRNTDYDGIVSDAQKTRAQETYEEKLKYYNLKKEKFDRDNKDKEKYNSYEFVKDAGKVALTAGEFVADTLISTVGAAGVGFVGTGMTTDGKKETISQAATNFLSGYAITNDIYDQTRKNAIEYWKEGKGVVKNITSKLEEREKKAKEKEKDTQTSPIIEELKKKKAMEEKAIEDAKEKFDLNEPTYGIAYLKDKTRIEKASLFTNRVNKKDK